MVTIRGIKSLPQFVNRILHGTEQVLELVVPARVEDQTDPKIGLAANVESTLWIIPEGALLTGSRTVIIARRVVSSSHGMGSYLWGEPCGWQKIGQQFQMQ